MEGITKVVQYDHGKLLPDHRTEANQAALVISKEKEKLKEKNINREA